MAARRKFYKLQAELLGVYLYEAHFGDFTICGPRESDGFVLVERRTPTSTEWFAMTPDGLRVHPALGDTNPRDFGYRGALTLG